MIFFTADPHFGHANVIAHCGRPFATVQEMDAALVERWNAVVTPRDDVHVLGDLSFHRAELTAEILARLNGRVHLVLGNHDRLPRWLLDRLAWVGHYREIRVAGVKTVLCHYPFESWNGMHRGSVHLHGHQHGSGRRLGRRLDVGVDAHDFRPWSADEVAAVMAGRTFEPVDHHL